MLIEQKRQNYQLIIVARSVLCSYTWQISQQWEWSWTQGGSIINANTF